MDLDPLTEETAAGVVTWFDHDDEGRRRVGFYAHHPKWWHLVVADEDRHGFVATVDGAPVGLVDLELRDGAVNVSVYIRQEHRGYGHGVAALTAATLVARSLEGATQLRAEVEEDNAASMRSCAHIGMTLRSERNKHQELVFELDLTSG